MYRLRADALETLLEALRAGNDIEVPGENGATLTVMWIDDAQVIKRFVHTNYFLKCSFLSMRGARGIEYSRVGDDARQPLIMYRRLRVNGELVHATQLPHSANLALRLAQV